MHFELRVAKVCAIRCGVVAAATGQVHHRVVVFDVAFGLEGVRVLVVLQLFCTQLAVALLDDHVALQVPLAIGAHRGVVARHVDVGIVQLFGRQPRGRAFRRGGGVYVGLRRGGRARWLSPAHGDGQARKPQEHEPDRSGRTHG